MQCYDVRFPEHSILLRKLGATILTYPSAFTNVTGQAHWEVLLRARAVENQCFVIAAAQYGKHNEKRTSYGQSMVLFPKFYQNLTNTNSKLIYRLLIHGVEY